MTEKKAKKKYEAGRRTEKEVRGRATRKRTEKELRGRARNQEFEWKKGGKAVRGRAKKQRFFEKKKNRKKNFNRSKRPVQQRARFGGPSFSHEKTGDMFKIYCKNQYETNASVSPELNNNIY